MILQFVRNNIAEKIAEPEASSETQAEVIAESGPLGYRTSLAEASSSIMR
jgi:hypothetical protein